MSTYQDLIAVIRNLYPGDNIEITVEWCSQKGLSVDSRLIKEWGKRFHQDYPGYSVHYTGKTSDNLHHYTKI